MIPKRRDTISHPSEWLPLKREIITHVDVKKWNYHALLMGMENDTDNFEKEFGSFFKY